MYTYIHVNIHTYMLTYMHYDQHLATKSGNGVHPRILVVFGKWPSMFLN